MTRMTRRCKFVQASVPLPKPRTKGRATITISDEEDEIPPARAGRKAKVPVSHSIIFSLWHSLTSCSLQALSENAKGKRRATSPAMTDDEGAILSDQSLEYNENASPEESDGSGSEYQVSDNDDGERSDASDALEEDEIALRPSMAPRKHGRAKESVDNDDVMLGAAIQMSLEDGGDDGVTMETMRRVTADVAARRAVRGGQEEVSDIDEVELSELSALDGSEDDMPLLKKGKGKARAPNKSKVKGKGKRKVEDTMDIDGNGKFMTLAQLRKKQAAERKAKRDKKAILRTEERELRKKLGRALTMVTLSSTSLTSVH